MQTALLRTQCRCNPLRKRFAGRESQSQSTGDSCCNKFSIGQRPQFGQPDAISDVRQTLSCCFQAQPRLADAACTDECDNAMVGQQ